MNIVILGSQGSDYTNALYHKIEEQYQVTHAILEASTSKLVMLKRRAKKLGIGVVVGQLLFKLLIEIPLKITSRDRCATIIAENNLILDEIPEHKTSHVSSVNSLECIELLKQLNPDVVFVMGTRIIAQDVLSCVNCRFVNMHTGITPLYRGVHGGYWAIAENDQSHCGVTLHFVDNGIDTGAIIRQAYISPNKQDNFVTYPYLQLAAGLEMIPSVIDGLQHRDIKPTPVDLPSKLRSHPTLLQYLRAYVKYRAK